MVFVWNSQVANKMLGQLQVRRDVFSPALNEDIKTPRAPPTRTTSPAFPNPHRLVQFTRVSA